MWIRSTHSRRSWIVGGVGGVAACVACSALAGETEPSVADLQQQIHQLESKIAQLESGASQQLGPQWMNGEQKEQLRALVREVVEDAQGRTSLLADNGSAGYDGKGFFLASPDNNFRVYIWNVTQARWIWSHVDSNGSVDGDRSGFEMTRTTLGTKGHLFSPDTRFNVWGLFDRSGGGFKLFDAYLDQQFGEGWAVRVGQFKPYFTQEFTVSFRNGLLVDRSLVSQKYSYGRTQGIELSNTQDQFRFFGAFTDGIKGQNVAWSTEDVEYAFMGRVEFMPIGTNWGEWMNEVGFPGSDEQLMLGAAATFQDGEYGTTSDETEIFRWTVDGTYKGDGWNCFASLIGSHEDSTAMTTDEWAVVVHGGVFVVDDVQVFGRFEWADPDGRATDDLMVITGGLTKFWHQHALKWTTDLGYSFNEIDSYWTSEAVGWRTDAPGHDGQMVLRTQLQFAF